MPAPVRFEVVCWTDRRLGTGAWLALLDDIDAGAFTVGELTSSDCRWVRELRDRHADADIGIVDAAVLAVTERLAEPKVATVDHHHFGRAARPNGTDAPRDRAHNEA